MKTKQQRQKWWFNLTPNQKSAYIDKVVAGKSEKRKQKSIKLMSKYPGQYKCSECFHGLTQSCTDNLPNGCEYWFNPHSKKQGISFEQQQKRYNRIRKAG